MTDKTFPMPSRNAVLLDFLANRRSNKSKAMTEPGPDDATLREILSIGTRVPDHRKLSPWRIVVFRDEARERIGSELAAIYRADHPDHPDDRQAFEAARFLRAPIVLMVVSAPVDCVRGTPVWEQELSVGAVCMMLLMAAQASGFGAQWLSEWYAHDPRARAPLGLQDGERIAGFIHIGTPTALSTPRPRPNLDDIVSFATP